MHVSAPLEKQRNKLPQCNKNEVDHLKFEIVFPRKLKWLFCHLFISLICTLLVYPSFFSLQWQGSHFSSYPVCRIAGCLVGRVVASMVGQVSSLAAAASLLWLWSVWTGTSRSAISDTVRQNPLSEKQTRCMNSPFSVAVFFFIFFLFFIISGGVEVFGRLFCQIQMHKCSFIYLHCCNNVYYVFYGSIQTSLNCGHCWI